MDFLNHLNHRAQLFSKLFLNYWPEFIFVTKLILLKIIKAYNTSLPRFFPFNHICAHILCRFKTQESLSCHNAATVYVTYKTMTRFSTMHRSLPLTLEPGWQIWLRSAPKPFNSCHDRIYAWCTMHCEIRGTQGPLGYTSALALPASCTDWLPWALRASDLTMHSTPC